MAGIEAKHRQQMKFWNSHLTRNIFNLYMRRFFFGLVYTTQTFDEDHYKKFQRVQCIEPTPLALDFTSNSTKFLVVFENAMGYSFSCK